jgi:hypothetical protein
LDKTGGVLSCHIASKDERNAILGEIRGDTTAEEDLTQSAERGEGRGERFPCLGGSTVGQISY